MSSDRMLHNRSWWRALLPLAIAVLLAPACGRKEDPQPPPSKNPAKTSDLQVRQRGEALYVTMTYPAVTMGGLALPGIDRVEYERYTRPAPEFMEVPDEAPTEEGTTEADPTSEDEAAGDADATAEEGAAASSPATEADDAAGVEVEELEPEESYEAAEEEEAGEGEEDESVFSEGEPAGTETAEPNPYLLIRVDADDFEKRAEEVLVLEATELESAVVGGQVVARFPLDAIPTEPPLAYSFRVRTFAGRLKSPDSNIASFVPLPVPDPPASVTLESTPTGVRLTWEVPQDVVPKQATGSSRPAQEPSGAMAEDPSASAGGSAAEDSADAVEEASDAETPKEPETPEEPQTPDELEEPGDEAEAMSMETSEVAGESSSPADEGPIEIEGFNVYRRLAESSLYPSRPLAALQPTDTEYVDRSAQFGSSYVYAVTTVRMRQPLVESDLGEEVAIEYEDDFAPQPPRGLVLLAETGRTRLVWEANEETDLVGYLVFVREGDGAFEPLTSEPIAASEFVHSDTTSGITYTYRLLAVDTAGNESAPSREATTRAP